MSVGCRGSEECFAIQRGTQLTVMVLPFVVFVGTVVWAIRQMRLGRRSAWIAAGGILLILTIFPACEAVLSAAQDDLSRGVTKTSPRHQSSGVGPDPSPPDLGALPDRFGGRDSSGACSCGPPSRFVDNWSL
jgi:hypothetical protein